MSEFYGCLVRDAVKVRVRAQGKDWRGRASTVDTLLSEIKRIDSESESRWVQVNVSGWGTVKCTVETVTSTHSRMDKECFESREEQACGTKE